jgi:hypothetical protein
VCGTCGLVGGGTRAEKSTGRMHMRKKTSWKSQKEMVRYSGRGVKVVLKCRNCRSSTVDEDAWRRRTEDAKAPGKATAPVRRKNWEMACYLVSCWLCHTGH